MKVIFLSAGRGLRMLPLTKDIPKPLLDIAPGVTIIDSQLKSLVECQGIKEVIFIVGYKAEMIEERVKNFDKLKVSFIYNPFYMVSNNLITLWLASHEMTSDFIVINGDNVFKPVVLKRLIDEPKNKEITMVIDKKENYCQEDMKVKLRGDRLIAVSKTIPIDGTDGESIGMMRFSGGGVQTIRDTLGAMVRDEKNKQVFYLEALQKIMDSGVPVHSNICDEEEWKEIDFHPDLTLIRERAVKFSI